VARRVPEIAWSSLTHTSIGPGLAFRARGGLLAASEQRNAVPSLAERLRRRAPDTGRGAGDHHHSRHRHLRFAFRSTACATPQPMGAR
jgi:hypothetical protein